MSEEIAVDAVAPVADPVAAPAPEASQAEAPAPAPAAAPAAPVEYTDFTVAEGQELVPQIADRIKEYAKANGLDQEAAQKLYDIGASTKDAMAAAQKEQVAAMRNEWAEQAKADKEIGGPKLTENLGIAAQAMDAFASKEFKAFLNDTGLGNHPEMVRLLVKVGKQLSTDTQVPVGRAADLADPSKAFFPTMAQKAA